MISSLVKEGDWVILSCPDSSERLFQVKSNEDIDLGRFGRFSGALLIGHQHGGYFSIDRDGQITLTSPTLLDLSPCPSSSPSADSLATNQTLEDTNSSQKLSTTEIEELKRDLTDKDVVQKVIEGSNTFTQKNAFSQIKYVQRKQKKYMKWFSLRECGSRTLCSYFLKRDPRKIMDLRLDSLSQIICLSNVQVNGSKTLIWDETLGFLTGAILMKTDPTASIVNVHPDRQMQVPSMMYFNPDESTRNRLHSLCLSTLDDPIDETFTEYPDCDPQRTAIQKERFYQRSARRKHLIQWVKDGQFDSLIVAINKTDPMEILASLGNSVRSSGKIVLYSCFGELLLPIYMSLRKDSSWVDVSLNESWLRPYQASPGRIHPHMNCNGNTGSILSATKVSSSL